MSDKTLNPRPREEALEADLESLADELKKEQTKRLCLEVQFDKIKAENADLRKILKRFVVAQFGGTGEPLIYKVSREIWDKAVEYLEPKP